MVEASETSGKHMFTTIKFGKKMTIRVIDDSVLAI